jgi:hypothetical protein
MKGFFRCSGQSKQMSTVGANINRESTLLMDPLLVCLQLFQKTCDSSLICSFASVHDGWYPTWWSMLIHIRDARNVGATVSSIEAIFPFHVDRIFATKKNLYQAQKKYANFHMCETYNTTNHSSGMCMQYSPHFLNRKSEHTFSISFDTKQRNNKSNNLTQELRWIVSLTH